jgi:hypothetical protein
MGLLLSREMAVNTAWLTATALAADLRAWLQLLALDRHRLRTGINATSRAKDRPTPAVKQRGRALASAPLKFKDPAKSTSPS